MSTTVVESTKTCGKCGEVRPLAEYALSKTCRDGRRGTCRLCRNAQELERHYRDPDKQRRRTIKWRYGITHEEYDALVERQKGACAICGTTNPYVRRGKGESFGLHIDHDHTTGEIRGLLCFRCNQGIGFLADPEKLLAAADYLKGR